MTDHFTLIINSIGVIGVFLVLLAYLLLQIGKLKQFSVVYSFLNFIGSILILISLYFYWNLASGVIEISWLFISAYGLFRSVAQKWIIKKKIENFN